MRPARLISASASDRTALLRAAAFAAGASLPWVTVRLWPVILASAAALALLPSGRRRPAGLFLLVLALGAGLGVWQRLGDPLPRLMATWRDHGFQPGVTPITIEGRLLDVESLPEGRVALLVRLRRFEIPGRISSRIRRGRSILLRLTAPAAEGPGARLPRPGDRIELSARIAPPRAFRNPGAFDYATYLKARGIDLVGAVKSARLIRIIPARDGRLSGLASRARRILVDAIGRAADGEDDATVSFLAALLVGERDDLPPRFTDGLIRAGVYHIVALSGLNVALILWLASALLSLLPLGPRGRRILLVPCVLIYWVVARPSGSIARAALMALLCLGGALLRRRVSGTGALASASMLILGSNATWCGDAGFQLSFAATLGILLVTPRRFERPGERPSGQTGPLWTAGRWTRDRLCASLAVSASALVSTSLVTARHFQAMTPVALAANLFAVPIAALLLVLALLICALEPLAHPAAATLIDLARLLVALLDRLSLAVASPAGCSFSVLPPPIWLVLLGLSAVGLAGLCAGRVRRAALLFLVLAIASTAIRGRASSPPGRLEVIALDVGQGDSIFVRFPGGPTMLIDAGGFARSRFDVGAKVVAPALRALGHLRIDILAITHAHRDHLGGALAVLRSFSPGAVWLGRMPEDEFVAVLEEQAAARGIPVVFPRRGARVTLGGARVEVLNPGPGAAAGGPARNDDSLVLRVSYGARAALLTGDVESGVEASLLAEGLDIRSDLLKVAHHGSRTSSGAPFLRRVRASLGVISVGSSNPWGHPDAAVLERLGEARVTVFRTDQDGAVSFTTDGRSPWRAVRLTEGGSRESPAPTRAGGIQE